MPPSLQQPEEPEAIAPIAQQDYPVSPPPTPRKRPRWLIPAVVLAVLLALAAAWKFIPAKDQASTNQTTQQPTEQSSETSDAMSGDEDVPDVKATKDYSNGFLGLKLKHPDSWTVSEAENGVRLESPEFAYQTESKGRVSGNFRIYIRKGAREKDGTYIGRGYAIEPSQKLTYANPAPGQRADTNLTLFGLDEPTNFAFFMIAGNYALQKGDTLGPDYGKEAETYIIAGGFSDQSLTDDLATNPVSPDYIKTSKAFTQAVDILKSLNLR